MSLRATNDTMAPTMPSNNTYTNTNMGTNITTNATSQNTLTKMITSNLTNYIAKALRYNAPDRNASTLELNMSLGDMTIPNDDELLSKLVELMGKYTVPLLILSFIAIVIYGSYIELQRYRLKNENEIAINKEYTINPISWAVRKWQNYKESKIQLPRYHIKKAKESPCITAQIPKVLPNCARLDGAEKGQNIMLRLSVPYRRIKSSESLESDDEHRITITTLVEKTRVNTLPENLEC